MIQAIGITSAPRRGRQLAVDDLTFEAVPGQVTTLLGPGGSGKTAALRLLLQLDPGRGVALFRGRPLHRIRHFAREVGVLLGDVPAHPASTAHNHLRMLTAVAGVPARRAEELLDVVGLSGLAHQRLASFSLGMDRRLGIAAALLGDPHTLVLDEPTRGLSPRESSWLNGLLRGYVDQGGLVLTTTRDPREAARTADRVVTVERGRLVADQDVAAFTAMRLRPGVCVVTPHAERLAATLLRDGRTPGPASPAVDGVPLEVVRESGTRLSVYGSSSAAVGELAYRHGILVHRLTEEVADRGGRAGAPPLARLDGRSAAPAVLPPEAPRDVPEPQEPPDTTGHEDTPPPTLVLTPLVSDLRPDESPPQPSSPQPSSPQPAPARRRPSPGTSAVVPPRLPRVPRPGPAAPLRYELRRLTGTRTGWQIALVTVLAGLAAGGLLTAGPGSPTGAAEPLRVLAGWPPGAFSPLPPAAVGAGVLGALSFGQEFRYPVLAPAQAHVARRLGLLTAKLVVMAGVAVMLCLLTAAVNACVLGLLLGGDALRSTASASDLLLQAGLVLGLSVGCAWSGLLAAGACRSTAVGLAAVPTVPVVLAPVLHQMATAPVPSWLGEGVTEHAGRLVFTPWPFGADRWAAPLGRLALDAATHPVVASALLLTSGVLLAAALLRRSRWAHSTPRRPAERSEMVS